MANSPGDRLPGAFGKRVIYHRGTHKLDYLTAVSPG